MGPKKWIILEISYDRVFIVQNVISEISVMGKSKKEKKKQDYVTKDSDVNEDGFERKITEDAEVNDNSVEASQSKRKKMKREKYDEDKAVDVVGHTDKVKRKKKKDKLERTDLSQPTLPNLSSECVPNNLRQIVRNTLGLPVEDLTEHKSQNEIKKDENCL